jgi:hypothetical protein
LFSTIFRDLNQTLSTSVLKLKLANLARSCQSNNLTIRLTYYWNNNEQLPQEWFPEDRLKSGLCRKCDLPWTSENKARGIHVP